MLARSLFQMAKGSFARDSKEIKASRSIFVADSSYFERGKKDFYVEIRASKILFAQPEKC